MRRLLQCLPECGIPTNLLVSTSEGFKERNGIVVGLPRGTSFRYSLGTHLPSLCHTDPLLLVEQLFEHMMDLLACM